MVLPLPPLTMSEPMNKKVPTAEETMENNEIKQIYLDTKSGFDFFLSPSEQMDFWATFGQNVYSKFLSDPPSP